MRSSDPAAELAIASESGGCRVERGALMQTMRDQTASAFQKSAIFIAEGIQLIALHIEHTENVTVVVAHWHNNLRAGGVKRRQIAWIFMHIAYDDRFARIQRCAA